MGKVIIEERAIGLSVVYFDFDVVLNIKQSEGKAVNTIFLFYYSVSSFSSATILTTKPEVFVIYCKRQGLDKD